MEFVIEDNIPLPPAKRGRFGEKGSGLDGALTRLQVGQSILVPNKSQKHVSASARVCARRMADGRKFATRVVDGGVRVWRVA